MYSHRERFADFAVIFKKTASGFIDYFYIDNISSIMYYKEYYTNKLIKTGQAVIENDKLIGFKEKSKIIISKFILFQHKTSFLSISIFRKNDEVL